MSKPLPTLKPLEKKWFIFPEMIPGEKFRGYDTSNELSQSRGSFPVGQNMAFDKEDVPSVREGYEPINTEVTDATAVKSAHVFETRAGNKWELKTYATGVYGWLIGTTTAFQLIKGSFTTGKKFAFANIGQTNQIPTWCFFCNGTENPFRWTGLSATISSTTANTIVTSAASLANLGFTATGTVIVNGTEYAYTGLSTGTFTGVTADPTGEANGSLVIDSPVELTGVISGGTDPTKFAVAMAHDGRLHIRREGRQSVWDYSKLDDPDDHATGSTDGAGGTKEIEFSGPITAFGKLNKVALCLKKRVIKTLEFNQVGARLDSPVYRTLVSSDDKSTTLGAVNDSSTFSTPYGLVFVTADKKMILLTGVTSNSEPQYIILSQPVQSVFDTGVHDEGAGICVNNKIYYSYKEDTNSTANDTVLIADLERKTITTEGQVIPCRWDTPTIGWNVNAWTAIENSAGTKIEVHWHSSLNSNSYRIIADKTDNTASFTHTLRSWAEHFDAPFIKKRIDLAYVEIEQLENTSQTLTLLYDIDGNTARTEYTLAGTNTDNLMQGAVYNPFGASAFGSQKIGSNPQQANLRRYIYYLDVNPNTAFFNLSLQLSGSAENNDNRLVRFGFRVCEYIYEPDRILLKNTN